MTVKLDNNNHSVFSLCYHLILVIKYRKEVLDDDISDYLKEHFVRLLEPKGITLEEWNHDGDHVHILFRSVPNIDLSKAINSYKSVSSRFVKRDFPKIKQDLWKEMFWSRSYCLLTTGGASIDVIRKYIESQGMN
ncbi:IS200/IS605 family transposase [Bacillus sp. REN10]|uniref:IS200/IS605 family transposase n=1 Tax=Bacillus sp. REN10 TaxID=2782541 RepID=UPI00193BDB2B|nr:IS200/IS605 family transposase [Bacillus sp. REN10]